jgi:Ca-activated chloride channel family protein
MPDFFGLELRDPIFLLLAVLAVPVYLLAARLPATITYSSLALVDRATPSLRVRLSFLPAALLAGAVGCLAIAMAGPRTGDASSKVHREGIAIAMVVDRSGSMQARDFVRGDSSASRLDVVKVVFRDFVSDPARSDDLIGLVSFARFADGVCPLTNDHGNLLAILEQQEIVTDRAEDGTAVGEGLALAVERLRTQDVRSKVAILLTDGVSNAGDVTPIQAADLAMQHGIKVYTIGAGQTGWAPVPVKTPRGDVVLRRAYVEMDEATLREIAERSGGRYFHAASADGLEEVYREIDNLERTEITEVRYLQYSEHYDVWVAGSLSCIGLAALLGGSVLRRFP